MAYLIDVPVEGGGQLRVEATEVDLPADLVLASRPGEVVARAGETLERTLDQLRPALYAVRDGLTAVAPDELTVEFGLKLGAETGVVVAKGTTEVHFTVTMSWRRPDPGPQRPESPSRVPDDQAGR